MQAKYKDWKQIALWRNKLRNAILERDKHTCQSCGYSLYRMIIGKKMKLHIHHIDKNRKNNTHTNLITLCHSCHSKLHYRERDAKEILGITGYEETQP